MRVPVASLLVVVGLVGCDQMDSVDTDLTPPVTSTPATPATPSTTNDATTNGASTDYGAVATPDAAGSSVNSSTPGSSTPEVTQPDNTDVNDRDASGATKTPIDQDENQDDVNRTAEIRQRVLATEGMSVNARNVKIITSKGKVTLRGPVNSDTEKETIDKIAREVAGDQNVDNQIEVTKPQE
jgi:hyperosmotically inducible protein